MNLNELVKQVIPIARKAGEAILDIYETIQDFGIESKEDNSPLTIADKTANTIICEALEKLDPQLPIISEENRAIPYSERKDYNYNWLVDPLDGTKEFIKRNGEFTVNIALIHQHRPILGVVYTPVTKELYWAVINNGAYQETAEGAMRLSAPAFSLQDEGLGIVCSRSHLNEATQQFIDQFSKPERTPKGSSLKFIIIAKGQAHIYPRLAPTMEWDTAAAHIILEEAGGKVVQAETKDSLGYNKEELKNPSFIAYGNTQ